MSPLTCFEGLLRGSFTVMAVPESEKLCLRSCDEPSMKFCYADRLESRTKRAEQQGSREDLQIFIITEKHLSNMPSL